ncbi:hypothetical protein SDRG_12792 [Saprolegnia diclina VS20]|uniref:Uncharacterized protein n=1 Tax=Saprolegnia diclina (strain VS20) TaxID=1156394 RepID=T0RBJ7_SAPDV|nr:hypothetical protein SDRG_12792 [Saprolegnia diclina VS20]EQC29543.1 hypothetical protein SDRG_12792 [Saprolegnia diclina VS20]|eukprot:XP_008617095.1 hypothetical protein SDRG_12792 [Saprolegnia diclina VS20]
MVAIYYKVNSYVFVLPEQAPQGQLRWPVYAKITKSKRARSRATYIDLTTVATENAPAKMLELSVRGRPLPVVQRAEAEVHRLGLWLRQFVICKHDDKVHVGQVRGYDMATESLSIQTISGRIEVPRDNVRSCADVSALILWRLSSPTGTARQVSRHWAAAVRMQVAIRDRLTDLGRTSSNILDVLDDIVPRDAVPPPHASVAIVAPTTGKLVDVVVQHAVDFVFWTTADRRGLPPRAFGEEYWEPRMTPDVDDGSDDAASNRDDPDSDASNSSERSSASQGEDLDDASSVFWGTNHQGTPQDPKFGRADSEFWSGATGPAASASGRPVLNQPHLSADPRAWDTAGAYLVRARRIAAGRDAKRASTDFVPKRTEQAIHALITSAEYLSSPPSDFFRSVLHEELYFFRYPSVLRALYSFNFDEGQLSILHFQRRSVGDMRTWTKNNRSIRQDYSSKALLPEAELAGPPSSAIEGALTNLSLYAATFCHRRVQQFIAKGIFTVQALVASNVVTTDTADDLVEWIDSIFSRFTANLHRDVTGSSSMSSHEETHKLFNRDSIELDRLFKVTTTRKAEEFEAFKASTLATLEQLMSASDPSRSAGAFKNDNGRAGHTDVSHEKVEMSSEVYNKLPRQASNGICCRFLSARGCDGSTECADANRIKRPHCLPTMRCGIHYQGLRWAHPSLYRVA